MKTANKKPWGHELLAYQNDDIAIWHLFIDPWQETSLHCHPKKKTGLIVIDGSALVSFLSGSEKLFAGEKVMIRQGVFHKTSNMSNQVLQLFEIENPVDKSDLVRIDDKYNRSSNYKTEPTIEVDIRYPWERPDRHQFHSRPIGSCSVKLTNCIPSTALEKFIPCKKCNYMFVEGGIRKDHYVCSPGDIISGENFSFLLDKFDLDPNTKAIRVVNTNL